MRSASTLLGIALFAVRSLAQTATPTFDTATIKPSKATDDRSSWKSTPGYLVMRNQTLNACIRIAYGLKADEIRGGPKWLDSERFDIEARATTPAKDPELLAMLQTLLAERFQLKFHRDSKLVTGYELAVAKKGLKIHAVEPSGEQHTNWNRGQMFVERVSMPKFADALSRILHAPVADRTGLSGEFSFKLVWSPETIADNAQPDPFGRSLFVAVQEELGLMLNPTKLPVQVLVIDQAEKPSEN